MHCPIGLWSYINKNFYMVQLTDAQKNQILANAESIKALADQSITIIDGATAADGAVWDLAGVAGTPTFSNGGATVAATGAHLIRASLLFPPSSRYAEVAVEAGGNAGYAGVAIIAGSQALSLAPTSLATVPAGVWGWRSDGYWFNDGSAALRDDLPSFTTGDNIALFLNQYGEVYARKNGVWVGNPAARTGPLFTGLTGPSYTMAAVFFGANGSPRFTLLSGNPIYMPPAGALLYQP